MPSPSPSPRLFGIACLLLAILFAMSATPAFRAIHVSETIVPGSGVTETRRLSDWFAPLAGSPGDTPVYVLRGAKGGATALVLGGTHADEAAGHVAAVLLVERARTVIGRLIVVPRANSSAFTHTIGQEGHPTSFVIDTPFGPRVFTYGARTTNPVHQWPDPQVYRHTPSGQPLAGSETRNLNRAYPGRPDGTLTERVAFAITTLLEREHVGVAVDLHEASPEYPVVNTIVAHDRAMDLAALVVMKLQEQGVEIALEASPVALRGLSHREWGDSTPTLALLAETTSPAQGRLRGRTDAALVTSGRDRFYVAAAAQHRLAVPFTIDGWPLATRVARHVATVRAILETFTEMAPDEPLLVEGLPSYHELTEGGIGRWLQPLPGRPRSGEQ